MRALLASCVALAFGSLVWAEPEAPPVDFKIAFIGDQGLGPNAQAVLTLIRDEGASAVLHSGDFDYTDSPAAWDDQINGVLGANFPYFASAGNHDASAFRGPGGYQEFLAARMKRLRIPWRGDLGVQSSLTYNGIFIVMTAPGIFGAGDGLYDLFIAGELAADTSPWRISSWHEDMQLMQVGGKSDQTGWGVYEQSRRGGAIIATAHEHSYSRTYLLSSCQNQTVASTASTLVLSRDDPGTRADEGRSFVFVSGLGGSSIRPQLLDGPWWASVYTSTQGANYGALFGVFNYRGDPGLAYFYFKDIGGYVADEFFVRNGAAGASPACTSAGCDCRDRPDGAPCDDGNACTVDDACLGGACGGMPQGCHGGGCTGSPLACDDGDACTEDACDPAAGCRHTPIDLPAVKRALVRPEAVGACAGRQRAPIRRLLRQAHKLVEQAGKASEQEKRTLLITAAVKRLEAAGRRAADVCQGRAADRCCTTLTGRINTAHDRARCLFESRLPPV